MQLLPLILLLRNHSAAPAKSQAQEGLLSPSFAAILKSERCLEGVRYEIDFGFSVTSYHQGIP